MLNHNSISCNSNKHLFNFLLSISSVNNYKKFLKINSITRYFSINNNLSKIIKYPQ